MIDAYELLRTKENDLARVRREIESLRIVATLVSETNETKASQRDDDGRLLRRPNQLKREVRDPVQNEGRRLKKSFRTS